MVNGNRDPLLPGRAQLALWLSQQPPKKAVLALGALAAVMVFIIALAYGVVWLKCVETDGWGQGRESVCVFNGRVADWGPPPDQQREFFNIRGYAIPNGNN